MNPLTHALVGWTVAVLPRDLTLKQRSVVGALRARFGRPP